MAYCEITFKHNKLSQEWFVVTQERSTPCLLNVTSQDKIVLLVDKERIEAYIIIKDCSSATTSLSAESEKMKLIHKV